MEEEDDRNWKWSCAIERVDNGYVLKFPCSDDKKDMVIEEKEDIDCDLPEIKAMVRLLREIAEYFGVTNSKHNKHNLSITVDTRKDTD